MDFFQRSSICARDIQFERTLRKLPKNVRALPRWWPAMRWFLLAQAVSNILTNAYYLQLFEPADSLSCSPDSTTE